MIVFLEIAESEDWSAYIEGWSFERIGSPKPPPSAHGPDKRASLMRLLDAVPANAREGAAKECLAQVSGDARRGLFFDLGRMGARAT